jgi:general secretion pathway protein G
MDVMRTVDSEPSASFERVTKRDPRRARGRRRPCRHGQGFTLVEILVVLAFFGTLFAFAIPAYTRAVNNAKVARAIGDIRALEKDVAAYRNLHRKLPDTLGDINWPGLQDPWHNPYEYVVVTEGKGGLRKDKFMNPLNSTYDLYSMGKDGQTKAPLSNKVSWDDIIRANDGGYVGLAAGY